MKNLNNISHSEFLFGALLVVANKMDTLLERTLAKHGITSKQWFLLLVIFNLFEAPPTVKEAAMGMGSSHQNVKQMALKLKEKGMLRLEKDPKDLRATRLIPTEKSRTFWKDTEQDGMNFMKIFYKGMNEKTFEQARHFLNALMANISEMEEMDLQ